MVIAVEHSMAFGGVCEPGPPTAFIVGGGGGQYAFGGVWEPGRRLDASAQPALGQRHEPGPYSTTCRQVAYWRRIGPANSGPLKAHCLSRVL